MTRTQRTRRTRIEPVFARLGLLLAAAWLGLVLPGPVQAQTEVLSESFSLWPPPGWTITGGCGAWVDTDLATLSNYTGGEGDGALADGTPCGAGVDTSLVSPVFGLPPTADWAELAFRHDFYAATGSPDTATVQIAVDGGAWTTLDTLAGDPLRGPLHRSVDLSAYAGQTDLRIRFRLQTDEPAGPVNHWWWQIDDVRIRFTACASGPIPTVSGGGAACAPPGAELNTETYASYQWRKDGADIAGATLPTHAVTGSGDYSVRVTDDQGCSGESVAVTVTVSSAPGVPEIVGPALSCSGTGVLLTALGGPFASYQWSESGHAIAGATEATYDATASGWYTVEATAVNGCASISSGHALVIDDQAPEVSGADQGCGVVNLSTGPFSSYQWLAGGQPIPGAVDRAFQATADGDYSVQVTSALGCLATSAVHPVAVTPSPVVTGSDTNACPQSTVPLAVSGPYVAYTWLRNGVAIAGAAGPALAVQTSGNYTVVATDGQGCASSSAPHAVTIQFCATSEVSPHAADHPLRLSRLAPKGPALATELMLTFQAVGGAEGYNVYEGTLGSWYSHGAAPGNQCAAAVTDLGDGSLTATVTPSAGNRYYLVTAYASGTEGPSGADSTGAPIPPSQSTCAP
ncbi:MAG: hypothetical protein MUF27_11525 [Acidobacteria bacterium]|jgi:hypothetical protein|nr:hypothetical protein [Acidobacteriota bacterium]